MPSSTAHSDVVSFTWPAVRTYAGAQLLFGAQRQRTRGTEVGEFVSQHWAAGAVYKCTCKCCQVHSNALITSGRCNTSTAVTKSAQLYSASRAQLLIKLQLQHCSVLYACKCRGLQPGD